MELLGNIAWGIVAIVVLLGLALLLSVDRKNINVRTVLGALALQLVIGMLFLGWGVGEEILAVLSQFVTGILGAADAGIDFLFGEDLMALNDGNTFFIHVLSVIIFFAALMGVLFYIGFMPWLIKILGGLISRVLGTSKVESIAATANIFVGITESPLTIKPYLNQMTRSEFFTVMTVGLGTVAGSVLGGLVAMGAPVDYLIVASFMAAPAGLVMAKMVIPESDRSKTTDDVKIERDKDTRNVIDAAARGTTDGLRLALNVGAMVLAFVSLVELFDIGLGLISQDLTVATIFGFVFSPLAFLIGVPWEQAMLVGQMIAEKTIINEFVGFGTLIEAMEAGAITDPRTIGIATFALSGFANIGTIAIMIGGLGALVPERRQEIAQYGPRALIAAILGNLMNGAIAGMLIL
ncbi:NupC/NupG family nucleoside CNT transporter [Natribacillus halophilus]|uniref:Concentrative nucleoside transporter, CNT family n=1 Tax=Natribacillus halophilus TaxID=549003 RepID=A0A1G8NL05_9BACI|nr:nucleoside transporter C-terminal domain-containing protein [Natribacillus halophilus]SDI80858.1 concentrative nucleoside transporter, CNT family [Natribacillus halophilus]